MARVVRIALRGLRALLLFMLAVVGLVVIAYAALSFTPTGRTFVRDLALEQVNALVRGKVIARELSSFGVTGLRLRGVEVSDPFGARVLVADELSVELSPLALLAGEVHVDRVAIDGARIELADLGSERGAIAAFSLREPSPSAEPQTQSELPVIVVTAIELDGVAISLQVPELGVLGVRDLSLRGSFALRGTPSAKLTSLTAKLVRDAQTIGEIASTKVSWVLQGEDTSLALRARVAQTRIAIDARSRLPNDPAFARSPMTVTMVLDAVDAELLRALGQHEIARSLKEAVRLELTGSGTLDALDAQLALSSPAGGAKVTAALLERDRLAVTVQSDGIMPSAIWVAAPSKQVAVDLATNLRIAHAPAHVPFDLVLKSASLDGSPLPVLRAQGRVENQGVRDLNLHAQGPAITLDLSGNASMQQLDLRGAVRARGFELAGASAAALDADIAVAGAPTAPRGSIALRGTGLRFGSFAIDQLALDAVGGPESYEVKLNGRAPDGKLQLTGRVQLLDEVVQIDASARGALRKRPFKLQLQGVRVGYGGAVRVERARIDALGQRAVLRGRYGAAADDRLTLDAQLDLRALSAAFELEPQLQGRADLELTAHGTTEQPRAELTVHGRDVGLFEPARKRPTVDVQLAAQLDVPKGELGTTAQITSGDELDVKAQLAAHFNPSKAPWYRQLLASHVEGTLSVDALSTEWLEQWLLERLPMRGRVQANATFAGTVEQPELSLATRAQLSAPELTDTYEISVEAHYADSAAQLALSIRDTQGEWIAATAALQDPAQTVQQFAAKGAGLAHEAEWNVTLKAERRALLATPLEAFIGRPLDPELAAIAASATISITHAPRSEPSARVGLTASRRAHGTSTVSIGLKEYECADPELDLSLIADLSERKLDARMSLASAQQVLLEASASADVALEPALSASGALSVSNANAMIVLSGIDLATLPQLCGFAQGQLSGRIDATGLLSANPRLSVQLKGTKLSAGAPAGIDLDLRASATLTEAATHVTFVHGATRSTITGRMPIRWQGGKPTALADQSFEAEVRLNRFPVTALLPPSFAISRASGYLSGAIRANGTLSDPKVSGRIEPEKLALTVTGLAQPLHGIEGRIAFSNRRIVVERLVLRDRDGSVVLKGSAELAENHDVSANLSIHADGFPLRQQGQVAGEIDAEIRLAALMTEHKTRVDIRIEDASAWLLGGKLRRGIGLDDHPDIRDPRATRDEVPEQDDVPAEPIEISINAEDSFWIRRDDFAVKLSTKLELSIANEKVDVIGQMQIHRGYLQLFGKTFDVDGKSTVSFDGGSPPDPVLDITASTINRASGKTITVHIGGRSSAPVLAFTLDGAAASVGEAAAEIFGGRAGGSDEASAKGEAKSFVAGMMAGVMAMSARREFGDVVPILMIDPADGAQASRVRAGFELDKLVPDFLEDLIRGVYLEGILAGSSEEDSASSGMHGGVLLELYLPHDLVTALQYGPGETWSVDLGWEP